MSHSSILRVPNSQTMRDLKENAEVISKATTVENEPVKNHSAVTDLLSKVMSSELTTTEKSLPENALLDLAKLVNTPTIELSTNDMQDLYTNAKQLFLSQTAQLDKLLPETVRGELDQEVIRYVNELPGLGIAASIIRDALKKKKSPTKHKAKAVRITDLKDGKDPGHALNYEDEKDGLRLFSAVKMLESTLSMENGSSAVSAASSTSAAGGKIAKVMNKVAELIKGDVVTISTDINHIMQHFKICVEQSTQKMLGDSESPQIMITSSDDALNQFKHLSMVAMMSKLFVIVDDAMIGAGTFFLDLSKAVAHLQEELGPTISLLTGLASQMQTLLSSYQAANIPSSGSQPSPWSSASNLGFGITVVPGVPKTNRTYTEDTSYGVYPVYPYNPQTDSTPGDPSPLVKAAMDVIPSSYIANSVLQAYNEANSNNNVTTDFSSLSQYVGSNGQPFANIQDLADALSNKDSLLKAAAEAAVAANPRLLNTVLGNSPDQSRANPAGTPTPMNTGFFVQGLPANLIALSNGSILSSPSLSPLDKNGNTVPGNWSIVTISSITTIMKNLSMKMHSIQIIDNGESADSSGQTNDGVLYNSLKSIMSTAGLNNSTINDYVSNSLNPAATTLGSTQQDLSQFASKLINQATSDVMPLLQSAIQAWLKAFQ